MLILDRVGVRTGDARVLLEGVTLSVAAGSWVVIVGPSGAGKTRLAELIADAPIPEGLSVHGSITGRERSSVRCRTALMLRQNAHMLFHPYFRLRRVVADIARSWGREPGELLDEVVRVLGRVGIARGEAVLRCYPHELSGGQRQRIALTLPIVLHPQVVVLDESLSNLDALNRDRVLSEYRLLIAKQNTAVVITTHRPATLSLDPAQIVVVGQDGRVVEQGEFTAVCAAPSHELTARLLERAS